MGVVSPETVAETTVPLAATTDPSAISGRFFQIGREEVEVPDGVDDSELRQRLWERSAELSGLTDEE